MSPNAITIKRALDHHKASADILEDMETKSFYEDTNKSFLIETYEKAISEESKAIDIIEASSFFPEDLKTGLYTTYSTLKEKLKEIKNR